MDVTALKEKVIVEFCNILRQIRKGHICDYQDLLDQISFIDLIQNDDLNKTFSLAVLQYYINNNEMSETILIPNQGSDYKTKIQVITQSEYDNLKQKDTNTIYSIIDNNKIVKVYNGDYKWDICNLRAVEVK